MCVVLERIEAAAVRDTPDVNIGSFGVESVCNKERITHMLYVLSFFGCLKLCCLTDLQRGHSWPQSPWHQHCHPLGLPENILSSPRAESARAVTDRRCPHSGRGEDFLTGQPDFFTETAVTSERKVEKSFPRWEINRHVEG